MFTISLSGNTLGGSYSFKLIVGYESNILKRGAKFKRRYIRRASGGANGTEKWGAAESRCALDLLPNFPPSLFFFSRAISKLWTELLIQLPHKTMSSTRISWYFSLHLFSHFLVMVFFSHGNCLWVYLACSFIVRPMRFCRVKRVGDKQMDKIVHSFSEGLPCITS